MGSTARSLAGIAACVVVGGAVTLAGGAGGARGTAGLSLFAVCALIALAINWVAFVPAYLGRTERFYDLTGTLSYLTVVVVALVGGPGGTVATVLAVLVGIWAVRLGTFLVARIRSDGSDGRFDDIKGDPARFLLTWTMQALWVVVTAAAALGAMTSDTATTAGWVTAIGVAIWLVGFGIEATADAQKRAFRADPSNRGRFISSGLWAWSRHPNYFGEITLWVGVAVVALPALQGWQHLTLVSPVFVAVLLTRVSGVPLLEARARRRWGDEPAYQDYLERTPVLVPRPPRVR